jgi:predicted regulator of Ras-like GTPase activity (Roadblock/LC7/MglB family)
VVDTEFERLRKKVENYPSASAYNRLAELARLNGNVADAEQICTRCIKEFPRNGQAYVTLAEIALAGGKREDAIKHLQNAVERDNRSYSGHRMLADLYVENKDTPHALHHLRQILVFKPNDAPVAQRIGQLIGQGGTNAPTEATSIESMKRPDAPAPIPLATAAPAPAPAARSAPQTAADANSSGLGALCSEPGVKGAVIADAQGRVVMAQNLAVSESEILAALASDISNSSLAVLKQLGHDQLASWIIEAEKGQIISFKRDASMTLAILASANTRAALLELRARQTLINLGTT